MNSLKNWLPSGVVAFAIVALLVTKGDAWAFPIFSPLISLVVIAHVVRLAQGPTFPSVVSTIFVFLVGPYIAFTNLGIQLSVSLLTGYSAHKISFKYARRVMRVVAAVFFAFGCFGLFVLSTTTTLFTDSKGRIVSRKIDFLRVGESETTLRAKLGEPDEIGAFRLGQYEGFEEEYAQAAKSNSKTFYIYFADFDVICAVGIGNDNRVTTKACGGT